MVLLTGTSGFIGSALLNKCAHLFGEENIVVLSSKENKKYPTVHYEDFNVNPTQFSCPPFNQIKTVFHVGAFIPKSNAELNDVEKSNANISFTQQFLSSLPQTVEKFIFFSTVDVYETCEQLISENTPTIPETMYGFSKLYCEKMVEQWARSNNKIIQVIRLGHVYGPGEGMYKKIIPVTMQHLKNNQQPVIMGDGSAKRGFIYIDDLIDCVIKISEFESYQGPINLVNENQVTVSELVKEIILVSKKDISPLYVDQKTEQRNIVFDATKLKSLLKVEFTPMQIGLKKEWDSI
jgi:UDP-glucose 4-epimerase